MLLFCVTVTPPSLHHFPGDRSGSEQNRSKHVITHSDLAPRLLFPELSFLYPSPSTHHSFFFFDICGFGFLFCHTNDSTGLPFACLVVVLFFSVGSLHLLSVSVQVGSSTTCFDGLLGGAPCTPPLPLPQEELVSTGGAASRWQFKRDL